LHGALMKSDELRAMIRKSDQTPIRICMDDGQTYLISHPDFGFVADTAIIVAKSPGQDLGGASFVVCYFDHISRIESLEPKKAA
jgi:diacylglycerol kinase family enzyme